MKYLILLLIIPNKNLKRSYQNYQGTFFLENLIEYLLLQINLVQILYLLFDKE